MAIEANIFFGQLDLSGGLSMYSDIGGTCITAVKL